jgi:hypothetical protein
MKFDDLENEAIKEAEISILSNDLFKKTITLFNEESINYDEVVRLFGSLLTCTKVIISFLEYLAKDSKLNKKDAKWIINSFLITNEFNINKFKEINSEIVEKNPPSKKINESDFIN